MCGRAGGRACVYSCMYDMKSGAVRASGGPACLLVHVWPGVRGRQGIGQACEFDLRECMCVFDPLFVWPMCLMWPMCLV